ncbi:IS5 family transposase [Tunicatimonas pelagia]|nr:IS5 family transposase [Tunicatimonas pelagia]WKN42773.1 IS5 family transposase [Tunicatimonas pelagia]
MFFAPEGDKTTRKAVNWTKTWKKMLGRTTHTDQLDAFRPRLDTLLSNQHELVRLTQEIDWRWIEDQLADHYAEVGRPSVPVRTMVGMLLLKHLFNESDESVLQRWVENPYWQYFTGEQFFQHRPPFDSTDFPKFRRRIGEQSMEKVLALTVKLHPGAEKEAEPGRRAVQIDPTVQEKAITFPTDTKLQKKIIEKCRAIAKQEGIQLRQSYRRTLKALMLAQRNSKHPKRRKKASAARRKIKTIAGRLVRELNRKLTAPVKAYYQEQLALFERVLNQKRHDKNKVYSLHAPEVCCIAKGKEHKPYDRGGRFGSKVSLVRGASSGIITGVTNLNTNIYDGHTLEPALTQSERIRTTIGGNRPKVVIVDRGCRGQKHINGTQVFIPTTPSKNATAYQKRKARKRFRQRAGVEPTIGHINRTADAARSPHDSQLLERRSGRCHQCSASGQRIQHQKAVQPNQSNPERKVRLIFELFCHWLNASINQQPNLAIRI